MTLRLGLLFGYASVLVLASCGSPDTARAPDSARVGEEIADRLARHAEALARADVEAALELYTEDAIVRPANMEPVRGRAALRDFFTGWFSAMQMSDVSYATDELTVHGDTAYQIGSYRGTIKLPGERGVTDRGSFSVVWKRQPDGSWRYHRGIFNSSLPAQSTVTSKGQ